ncbi:hypothetical protein HZH68_001627 [Vespula germanica]|uniref:Uncharacterized protein n=1 Tax=Vespula germanica TaxID=30212 RepID=A0A834NWG1_VESGE|nr:hypothetical protein HZH68_001627 [Vespula germanica]
MVDDDDGVGLRTDGPLISLKTHEDSQGHRGGCSLNPGLEGFSMGSCMYTIGSLYPVRRTNKIKEERRCPVSLSQDEDVKICRKSRHSNKLHIGTDLI